MIEGVNLGEHSFGELRVPAFELPILQIERDVLVVMLLVHLTGHSEDHLGPIIRQYKIFLQYPVLLQFGVLRAKTHGIFLLLFKIFKGFINRFVNFLELAQGLQFGLFRVHFDALELVEPRKMLAVVKDVLFSAHAVDGGDVREMEVLSKVSHSPPEHLNRIALLLDEVYSPSLVLNQAIRMLLT